MATSRDVQEIIGKLSSDKTKVREEGIKLLTTWLEGERAIGFCKYLTEKTAKLKPNEIPQSETWPFLVKLLIQCVSLEISASKRRSPKLIFAKTLRIVVQRAEDCKLTVRMPPLLSVAKTFFSHIWDVLNNVPSFQSEYGIILRHLITSKSYRFHVKKQIYSNFLFLYMEKVEASLRENNSSQYNPKEEVFRSILTLQSLIENPPGDFPGDLREDIVKHFVCILSHFRDEGKISRKLIECLNTYLSKDGPNLGCKSLKIHESMQQFVYHCLGTTHDKGLKDALILYARQQLSLVRGSTDRSYLVEQLLDVVCKELDQGCLPIPSSSRSDMTKDDKFGVLSSTQSGLADLAAYLFYQACNHSNKALSTEKRLRMDHPAAYLKEALGKGKWLWIVAFCSLVRNYKAHIGLDLFIYWFEGIFTNFERIMNDGNIGHSYDSLYWTLRSLQELSTVLLISDSQLDKPSSSKDVLYGWQSVWSCLMHGLPIFSNISPVVDAALVLLGNIVSHNLVNTCVVPQDVWDLWLFKGAPSLSALYFMGCYFSCKGSQGDHRDALHLRRNLLKAALSSLSWKDSLKLNELLAVLLPAAIYALCSGSPVFGYHYENFAFLLSSGDVIEAADDGFKTMEFVGNASHIELFDCCVKVLTKIDPVPNTKNLKTHCHEGVYLTRQLSEPLLHELETYFLGNKLTQKGPLSDVFFQCALLLNMLDGSLVTRKRENSASFIPHLGNCLLELLHHAVNEIQCHEDSHTLGSLASIFCFGETNDVVVSFKGFISCPFFAKAEDERTCDAVFYDGVIQSLENLLRAIGILYDQYTEFLRNLKSEDLSLGTSAVESNVCSMDALNDNKSKILDMELDLGEDSKDILGAGGENVNGMFSVLKCKMGMLSFISSFFSVLHSATWDILWHLLENETDPKVREAILYSLCQHPHRSSAKLLDMVSLVDNMLKTQASLKLDCTNVVASICDFIGMLLAPNYKKVKHDRLIFEREDKQFFQQLGELLIKVSEYDLLDWFGRVKLAECMSSFILLSPEVGQTMIEKLLLMLEDADYRVRFSLSRQIGVLFQTWDGHEELFQDICSNFGLALVVYSRTKLVTAKEVLAAGSQDCLKIETAIITLMHLALHSAKIELEAVFMMCAVSAIEPSQRELVIAALDNLSERLQYESRMKYLEELIRAILFCWVACGISIVALLEIRHTFLMNAEPSYFIQYCCEWLLPALCLQGDASTLDWVAKIAGQSLASMIKDHFVSLFSICMTLHCSKRDGWEKGALALQSSILRLGEISENERDELIKKHMVSIVSHIFSLACCSSDLPVPYFSKDAVASAIQTVVDGFLEIDRPTSIEIVDKINIFRSDRVFMFIVEMHYKIAAAVNHRHKSHHLASVEVLVSILGHRAAISSTCSYLFNLIGQLIDCHALQDQCCRIIFGLLDTCKNKLSKEAVNVLGEQLPFLVSKLVRSCIQIEAMEQSSTCGPSEVLQLLLQLIVNSDSSLHDYLRELEPFPESHMFEEIRRFHQDLCQTYSIRDHLLRLAKRAPYLPSRLVASSLRVLHKKLLNNDMYQRQKEAGEPLLGRQGDLEVLDAVWTLVRLCSSEDASSIRSLISDLISKVGIWDPHCVVFHLPAESSRLHFCQQRSAGFENNLLTDCAISEELLAAILKVLKKYLMDDSVKIVDMTSQTLRGILATERGCRAMSSLDPYERSIIEVHFKGINFQLVEKLLLDREVKYKARGISVDQSTTWTTHNKNFEMWICPLVYVLISLCNDVILRLCQDIVLVKAEVAELLLPSVIVNLARTEVGATFHGLLSSQVQEHIFSESNRLIKSIQILLNALNELRLCYVVERTHLPSQRESTKNTKPSSYSSKSRSSSTKTRGMDATSSQIGASTGSWDKVYWLSIDYLAVARSAISCGSFFTSVMYVEQWCEEHFKKLTLGSPDFSDIEKLPQHNEILISAFTHINEPDSLYGIIQSHTLTSQIITSEHEGDWNKALEYYDLQVRSNANEEMAVAKQKTSADLSQSSHILLEDERKRRKYYKGLIRSLQKIGCTHVLDLYCQGLSSQMGVVQNDFEFKELQYEAAWRAGNWDFSMHETAETTSERIGSHHFNEHLHSCLRAFEEGEPNEFFSKLKNSKEELVWFVSDASEESTEYIYESIIKLQILYHLGIAWDLRWVSTSFANVESQEKRKVLSDPLVPTAEQLYGVNNDWSSILGRLQLHMNLLEPFMAFRRVLLKILHCNECTMQHLLQSASTFRKGSGFTQAAAALHEFKFLCVGIETKYASSYWLGRLEEAKLLRAQGRHEMAISLAKYVSQCVKSDDLSSDVHRLVGKWLAETRLSNSRTILEKFLKPAVSMAENKRTTNKKSIEKQSQNHFRLAHYTDALFRSYEERLSSNEWQAAMRFRKHKTLELEALIRQSKSSKKGEKNDYSMKIQELQKQLSMDKEENEKLLEDRDNFLSLALEGYKCCLVIGDKYDVRVVFRLVSLWFSLTSRRSVIDSMIETINEVQSYKFIQLVYQIASRMGGSKDAQGTNFQYALMSLVKKMAIDHPYHVIFQLLALSNGDRVKDKQRSRSSFVVDMDKKHAAEHLLRELLAYHGPTIEQMRQMVEVYIKLAELETRREDTNKRVPLPRDIRSLRHLELVPVVTASVPVDRSCQYQEGSFPYFKGLGDSIKVMNGINAPKVVECLGSDGRRYKQLAKSGNDDLRQDAVMEQFFGLVNTFLQNHQDTWKRRLVVRTYKVVPFTPSAGVLEWVDGTIPLGEYLIGSSRDGGAHGRYGMGDWSFMKCREHISNEKDKRKAFKEVCQNFRPVMHHFFLERFLQPADWFEKRLAFARSVAASSMVGYIVGLGDRHAMNILIDQATAEVVHIDLGVAFEQGLMLKTPERVPFRLTRDLVDGMGVTGVEGVFRRCCEETLSVMRTNKEALLTIIEVFIHDPLYKWALSPLKALQRQKEPEDDLEASLEDPEDEYEGNKDAARAMLRVKQKLDGYEEGELRSMNGQVQQLILDATDPERLCHMFPGWGSWM